MRDFSDNYRGYSDLNDYLCGRKQEQKNSTSQAQEIKQETGPVSYTHLKNEELAALYAA